MKKNKQRWIVIAAAAVLVVTAVVLVAVTRNRKKKPASEEDFMYRKYSVCSYSEHLVLYLDSDKRLHMIDTESGKDMVCCDRPNCTHEGASMKNPKPSCPAVFAGIDAINGPVLHNGHLYIVGNMTEEDVFKTQYLYEMDQNGENRKAAATLENVQDVTAMLYRDNYAVGMYLNTVEVDENGMIINNNIRDGGIFVINLENHKVQMGEVYSGKQSDIEGIYYENGAVYYAIDHIHEDVSDEEFMKIAAGNGAQNFLYDCRTFEIYRFDIVTGKTTLVKGLDHVMYPQLLDGDAYYVTPEGFFVYDGQSGETTKLPMEWDGRRVPYGLFFKSSSAFYYALSDPDTAEVTTYRLEDGKVYEVSKKRRGGSTFSVVMICGDSVYIDYDDENGRLCLGVMSLDDYNHGKQDVKKLRYVNEDEE
ncbi:MAG: hypothetical protein J5531_08755 [Lachnospiraceae bacterium]|nr:hypothetical protein [Lachnospiraceae bacterium]